MQSVDDRKIDRADVVDRARHNVMLEGLQVSREFSEDSDRYVAGQISASELLQQTRARYGIA
ncbi:MAG: antitoxin VbhA family protein [Galactobacter sp.]